MTASAGTVELVRRLMRSGLSPEGYAGRHGRNVLICSFGRYVYPEPLMEVWAHRLAEILRSPDLLKECEVRFPPTEEAEQVESSEE